ncbi:hypothetical protein ACFWGD_03415 [Corynebacterium sp. NPDC060344]|uniref:hypothetical protein n=1 Tax=Corynebacterium sp. NPDC060344 TaxID=3347101 RepID=UPI00364F4740
MIRHRALRRTTAALLTLPLLAAAACSATDGDGDPAAAGATETNGAGVTAGGDSGDASRPNPTPGSNGGGGGEDGEGPSSSNGGDATPTSGDAPPETITADAIQFRFAGTELLCWADADDGSEDTVFGCQGAAGWEATEGTSPASVLLFRLDEDGSPGEIKALQANAPVTAWEIQGVRGDRSYRLGDATIDLTDRERLTFTVGGSGDTASGWVTIDDYGWDE